MTPTPYDITAAPDLMDTVLDTIARVTVDSQGRLDDETIVEALGLTTASPTTRYLAIRGFKAAARDRDTEERKKLKVMQLEPGYYLHMEAARKAEDAKAATTKPVNWQAREAKRLAQLDAAKRGVNAKLSKAWSPIKQALELYETWKLATGKLLGLATKEELEAEASRESAIATGHLHMVAFYTELAAMVPVGSTVAASVPLHVAHQLRERVFVVAN